MTNWFWLTIVFAGILGLGWIGLGLYKLLPARIRERIENYHNN